MISLPFRRARHHHPTIDALYGMIVAQARAPSFYRGYEVPDTVGSRLEMIMLHLILVLRRLAAADGEPRILGQRLFDRFCQDVDDNFREMGVGDLSVPKAMRRVGEAYYGRSKAYENALADERDDALSLAVARNVFDTIDPPLGAWRLATYIRLVVLRLDRQEPDAIVRGQWDFPDPDTVAPSIQE